MEQIKGKYGDVLVGVNPGTVVQVVGYDEEGQLKPVNQSGGGGSIPSGTDRDVLTYDEDGNPIAQPLGWKQFSDQPNPPAFNVGLLAWSQDLDEFGFVEVSDVAKANSVPMYTPGGTGQLPVGYPIDGGDAVSLDKLNEALQDISDDLPIEKLTQNSNTGIAIAGRNPNNYGNIGNRAVDFSYSPGNNPSNAGATGIDSVAFGIRTRASSSGSVAFGDQSNASGTGSVAFGNFTVASGQYSSAFGQNNAASGNFSSAFGKDVYSAEYASFTIGRYGPYSAPQSSWVDGSPIFKVCNGASSGNRSMAYVLNNDGKSIQYGVASYDGDYSSSFTNNSLVSKQWVENIVTGVVNNTLTSTETSTTLNTAYPNITIGSVVRSITALTKYTKINATQWEKETMEIV